MTFQDGERWICPRIQRSVTSNGNDPSNKKPLEFVDRHPADKWFQTKRYQSCSAQCLCTIHGIGIGHSNQDESSCVSKLIYLGLMVWMGMRKNLNYSCSAQGYWCFSELPFSFSPLPIHRQYFLPWTCRIDKATGWQAQVVSKQGNNRRRTPRTRR